jgi:hypothetical protein
MGWFTKEAKAFGREFKRQGSILLFGKAPKSKSSHRRREYGAERQYRNAQRWARRHGFK